MHFSMKISSSLFASILVLTASGDPGGHGLHSAAFGLAYVLSGQFKHTTCPTETFVLSDGIFRWVF